MKNFKYALDAEGNLIGFGYLDIFDSELDGTEPFTGFDIMDYRKDLSTNEWIYDPIIMIPEKISKLQAVSHLLAIDRYVDLINVLNTDDTGKKKILFDAAHELDRESGMVKGIGTALGFDSKGIDDFFVDANKILV